MEKKKITYLIALSSYGNLAFSSIVNISNTLQYLKHYNDFVLNREIADVFVIIQLLQISQNVALSHQYIKIKVIIQVMNKERHIHQLYFNKAGGGGHILLYQNFFIILITTFQYSWFPFQFYVVLMHLKILF